MFAFQRRFLDRYEAKSWLDGGFRTWLPQSGKMFLVKFDHNEYQGDHRYAITLHLLSRAYQYTIWRYSVN